MTRTGLGVADLCGSWVRRVSIEAAGRRDDSTEVRWLQAGTSFVDVRRPPDRPSFSGVGGVDDLTVDQLAYLRRQEAYAGRFACFDGVFEWRHLLDLHVPGPMPDTAWLRWAGNVLLETGQHESYTDQWCRTRTPEEPIFALHLSGSDGRRGLLVRVGADFGWARGRPPDTDPDSLDCEFAVGAVEQHRWTVTASTLPFRDGCDLQVRIGQDAVTVIDANPVEWTIAEVEGAAAG